MRVGRGAGRTRAVHIPVGGLLCSTGFASWQPPWGMFCGSTRRLTPAAGLPLLARRCFGLSVSGRVRRPGQRIGWMKCRCVAGWVLPSVRRLFRLVATLALSPSRWVTEAFCFPRQLATASLTFSFRTVHRVPCSEFDFSPVSNGEITTATEMFLRIKWDNSQEAITLGSGTK